ncbi:Disulfide bond formation protein DsbB [Parasphingorhabdus marina DSM 22363]|uniref:Disulfide bond formation protein DsbB n=1 Tax=Parasphingorhabdus marina DSM 22363 TaxID=1123272 RepID=A0A1N6CN57_9SPHN|nr:disulfide bond formation protein B [Parasphingorhabdus marina]SIN59926.1 Disulfide bond formation protein DsbB [Parasphingorhabdus marina DSM 22363]
MGSERMAGWLAFLVPAGLLGGALVSQYGFGLYPCEMCIWQRWPHLAAILLAVPALFRPGKSGSGLLVAAAALAIFVSGAIGAFHAGVEYGWWEGLTSCATTGAVSLDSILDAPLVRCDVAPWSLLGISLAGYNFLLSAGGAILILVLMAKGRKGA